MLRFQGRTPEISEALGGSHGRKSCRRRLLTKLLSEFSALRVLKIGGAELAPRLPVQSQILRTGHVPDKIVQNFPDNPYPLN